MPIPNDPDHRWWVDATAQNPKEVNDLRNALLAFVAYSPGREPSLEGSGFIIAGDPNLP